MRIGLVFAFLSMLPSAAQAGELVRAPDEAAKAFAERVLKVSPDNDDHAIEATWNGQRCIFVDYVRSGKGGDDERNVALLYPIAPQHYREIDVTVGEQEGGVPDIAAIGFAKGRDAREKLIVLLSWNQQHYDVSGTLYEVRLFDAPKPNEPVLAYLAPLSHHFDSHTCDCDWRNGRSDRYPFKTIAAIKKELARIGF
jgi:hypothetical protein